MSLSSKLLVYAYYGAYNLPHEPYGESYHLYRIVNEYLTDSYVRNESCVRRDIETARRLNKGALCFDLARQLLDTNEVAARLNMWYRWGDSWGLCHDIQNVLACIDRYAPLGKRTGANIFALDTIVDIPCDVLDGLQGILGRFMHFVRLNRLERLANVFDPVIKMDGWWYHKFCVLTYMHRIIKGSTPEGPRLREAVIKFIPHDDEEDGNCPSVMAQIYGRFCGIGKEHFAHHKMTSMHLLFQYMRNDVAPTDERHPCFSVIKDFGRQCKDTYADLSTHADALYIHATTDKQKNMLFDLLCCVNASDIDCNCYDYIVKKFYDK